MRAREFSIRTPALVVVVCSALSGCLVGPDFKRPQSTTPDVFDRTQSAQAASKAVESDFQPQWWTLFSVGASATKPGRATHCGRGGISDVGRRRVL